MSRTPTSLCSHRNLKTEFGILLPMFTGLNLKYEPVTMFHIDATSRQSTASWYCSVCSGIVLYCMRLKAKQQFLSRAMHDTTCPQMDILQVIKTEVWKGLQTMQPHVCERH